MLNQQMLGRQIGELLGISQQAVSEIKKRYGLPRKPEETKDE
jgi:predicted transcriptional regulator